ncbi:hypothetical protein [Sphingobacterium kitahiroshimense]|uniref:hypothetical protein n=1 Tax=Sphingobacterium kitahiroshimense TaxID=470446 RepID=UPI0010449380|nr:hypothetical protein [Sphingobacterium kitahiroshimense]MCW2263744.1 hypothetical protein [Sphingobacterium kitahiroshimense]
MKKSGEILLLKIDESKFAIYNFRTKQDIYNEMTRKISFGSMIAAVGSVAITLVLGIVNYHISTKAKENSVLEIDSTSIKQIINETRSKSPIIIRDTIYLPQSSSKKVKR